MPASRLPSRTASPPPRKRRYWPLVMLAVAAVLVVALAALPASLIARVLPPDVHAEDFSGSLWHGSAGRITVDARDAGAIEWHVHPWSLLRLAPAADLRWVKVGFVLNGEVAVRGNTFTATNVTGRGPIEDLQNLGLAPGWQGMANVQVDELKGGLTRLFAAVGRVTVQALHSAQVANGSDLGNYELTLAPGAVDAQGNLSAALTDAGGPVEVKAQIHYSAQERTGVLSGTLRERPEAAPALRDQIDSLAQLRGRDSQGRIPADLEFHL